MPPAVKLRSDTGRAELDKQIAREVAALPNEAMRAMLPVLKEAQAELQRDLEKWLGDRADGNERFTAFRYRQALLQVNAALKKVRELEPALLTVLDAAGRNAGVTATKHVVKQVDYYSKKFQGAAYPIPLDQAAAIAEGRSLMIPRFVTSAARYAGKVGDDIKQQLAVGMLKGESLDELTNRLVKLRGPRGLVALRGIKGQRGAIVEHISEGLFRRYRYWAERVVRTEVLSAYNAVADASLRQYATQDNEIKRRWNAAGDWRTCSICRGLDGEVTDVDKPFKGGYESAPAHPNCRCNVGPWKDRWTPQNQAEAKEAEKTAALSTEEQIRKIEIDELAPLKHERFVAFDPVSGKRLFSQDGDNHSVKATPQQILQLYGKHVTHNHPARGHSLDTLSPTDVVTFAKFRLERMSAVAVEPEGIIRYTMRLGPGAKHPAPEKLKAHAETRYSLKMMKRRADIAAGRATPAQVMFESMHATWQDVAKQFNLVYEREVLQPRGKGKKR